MTWPLPPEIPWPRFLRLLRDPAPPKGWLEAAADLPELRKRPLLLRWVAQHPKAPAHLRATLLLRLPWKALAAVAGDATAHPQARSLATDRLQSLWTGMTLGERKALAPLAPRPLWPLVLRVPDAGVLAAFLAHPRLTPEALIGLLPSPPRPVQLDALAVSRWLGSEPLAMRVLELLDEGLRRAEPGLVLGQAAPWIKSLDAESRLVAASRLMHPALRRACRTWAIPPLADEE
jgi:hypothetical protein